jgi:hypothetical protein
MELKSFREWQLALFLDGECLSKEDQEFLHTIEARYGELSEGASEDSFKESLKSLLPQEPKPALAWYESELWTKSNVSITFFDPSPSPDETAFVGGSGASTAPNYVKDYTPVHA